MQTGQHGSAANKEQSSHRVSSSAEQRAGNWLDDTNSLAVYSSIRPRALLLAGVAQKAAERAVQDWLHG